MYLIFTILLFTIYYLHSERLCDEVRGSNLFFFLNTATATDHFFLFLMNHKIQCFVYFCAGKTTTGICNYPPTTNWQMGVRGRSCINCALAQRV